MSGAKVPTNLIFKFQKMNYYQITSGIEEDDSDEETDNSWLGPARQDELPSSVSSCLSQATVEDLMKELSRNSSLESRPEDNNNKNPVSPVSPDSATGTPGATGVLMRRKTSGRSYSHRASQRFSRLLEGVTSLVSMSSMTATRTEEGHQGEEEETEGPASLPYWVEASQNIYKVSREDFLLLTGECKVSHAAL